MLKQHEKSGRHQRLEKKLYKSENELKETLKRTELSLVEKAKMNTYITKCIHTIHYLLKNYRLPCLYADETESSSDMETFSMVLTYLSPVELKVKTTFFGIVNLNGKTAPQVMNVDSQFFLAKNIKLDKMLLSVLDETNAMGGKKNGLQRRIRNFSPFNIYINCRNHRLALCLPHLMKNIEYADLF